MSIEGDQLKLAEQVIFHLLKRIQSDPRMAYLVGPGSQMFDLVTAAAAALGGFDEGWFRDNIAKDLKYQPVAGVGDCLPELVEFVELISDWHTKNVANLRMVADNVHEGTVIQFPEGEAPLTLTHMQATFFSFGISTALMDLGKLPFTMSQPEPSAEVPA
jgi:hypothetical protein